MSARSTKSQLLERRAQLLVELLFQELGADLVARPTAPGMGYDLLVAFRNENRGTNTFAVELKATEQPVGDRFPIALATYKRIIQSNLPGILVVVDVKRNRLYYACIRANRDERGTAVVQIPVIELTDETKTDLRRRLRRADGAMAAAG